MAFTTMHFAVGMAGTGAIASVGALLIGRGWRWVPMFMTAGGVWACGPDLTRLFKEDFPSAPFAQTLASKPVQHWLDARADWFFFHGLLDTQPREFALHGLLGILVMYSACCLLLALTHRRPKKAINNPTGEAAEPNDHDTGHRGAVTGEHGEEAPRRAA